jgi:hypothetical protein
VHSATTLEIAMVAKINRRTRQSSFGTFDWINSILSIAKIAPLTGRLFAPFDRIALGNAAAPI